jgi:beta-glucosidase
MRLSNRWKLQAFSILFTAGVCLGFSGSHRTTATAHASIENFTSSHMEQRISAILKRMTLEEKVRMCFGGVQPGVVQIGGVPRLGIPPMNGTDGPRGVTGASSATAFPAGVGLAATWDPALLKKVGIVMGQEARGVGHTMIFAPAINIERDPLGGRFFEYYTEDPYLDAQLAPAMVQGIQSQHVASVVKHYCCNNREWNRDWYMSNVDERTLREIYLPGFKAAIQQGGAWGVMTAANGVNGHLAATNKWLLTTVLKQGWGFQGLVLTDFNQARSTMGAAFAGLDVGMPWGDWDTTPFGKPLMTAVEKGQVPESIVEDKARRVLRVEAQVGMLDHVPPTTGGSINTAEHQAVALQAAEESLVLLKNNGDLLPLNAGKLKTVAVLGPNANRDFCKSGYGGSSAVNAPFEITVLDGLQKELAGKAKVEYIHFDEAGEFEPIGPQYWKSVDGKPGMKAEYYNDGDPTPVLERIEPQINFTWEMRSPDPARVHTDNFHATFEGKLAPKVSGYYTFRLSSEDTATLWVDRNPIIVNTAAGHSQINTAIFRLEAGQVYDVRMEYHALVGDASLRLEWSLPRTKQQEASALNEIAPKLKHADAVIFVGGWGNGMDTEGADRQSMDFPAGQEKLIQQIAPLNPRTIVVLLHGSPFKLDGWIGSVPAVLDGFYPGMEGGTAVAKALFGDINPSGKLSFTWPKRLEDSPSHAIGTEDHDNVNYKEGIFVGYRYYDTKHIEPQFPFGYGLSYSSFRYSNLRIAKHSGNNVLVSADITNTSNRAGTEIVELYVAAPASPEPRPIHEMKSFVRIALAPSETRTVTMQLNPHSFAYWSDKQHGWSVFPGSYGIGVGASSRDIRLSSSVSIVQ